MSTTCRGDLPAPLASPSPSASGLFLSPGPGFVRVSARAALRAARGRRYGGFDLGAHEGPDSDDDDEIPGLED